MPDVSDNLRGFIDVYDTITRSHAFDETAPKAQCPQNPRAFARLGRPEGTRREAHLVG
jgi:hypothetical protein